MCTYLMHNATTLYNNNRLWYVLIQFHFDKKKTATKLTNIIYGYIECKLLSRSILGPDGPSCTMCTKIFQNLVVDELCMVTVPHVRGNVDFIVNLGILFIMGYWLTLNTIMNTNNVFFSYVRQQLNPDQCKFSLINKLKLKKQ